MAADYEVIIQPDRTLVIEIPTGLSGTNGEGVPVGGTTGQVLAKASNADYDTQWVAPSAIVAYESTPLPYFQFSAGLYKMVEFVAQPFQLTAVKMSCTAASAGFGVTFFRNGVAIPGLTAVAFTPGVQQTLTPTSPVTFEVGDQITFRGTGVTNDTASRAGFTLYGTKI